MTKISSPSQTLLGKHITPWCLFLCAVYLLHLGSPVIYNLCPLLISVFAIGCAFAIAAYGPLKNTLYMADTVVDYGNRLVFTKGNMRRTINLDNILHITQGDSLLRKQGCGSHVQVTYKHSTGDINQFYFYPVKGSVMMLADRIQQSKITQPHQHKSDPHT